MLNKQLVYNLSMLLIMTVLIGSYFLMNNSSSEGDIILSFKDQGNVQQVQLPLSASLEDYSRLEQIIPQNEIIQKLPDDAKLMISFYNFKTGERTWERDYTITKGNAVEGYSDDVDFVMVMHSRWLSILDNSNLCSVVQSAKMNGDFYIDLKSSKVKLLWKYKSVSSYKDCLGF